MVDDQERFAGLSRRLAEAQRRLLALPEGERRADLTRRLIAVTTAAKRGLPTASRRLDALLRELDVLLEELGGGAEYPDR